MALMPIVRAVPVAIVALYSLAPTAQAQTSPRGRPPGVPIPDSSGFSITVPYRGGYVNVPLSPSGQPLVPGAAMPGPPGPPAPPAPPGVAAPPAPPAPPGAPSPSESFGYQVIDPRATSPQPPPPASDSGFFVVPKP